MTRWPGLGDWVFALKTFAAALLSLYIALAIGLERPYWSMATVYIVSQPLIGSLRSKSAYRLLGTLVGAAMTIVLVPTLVNAPELLCLAMALWTGLCVYLGQLDRTPRSYTFLLAGYTTALIGFPAVTSPELMWDIALARSEEIWLGIICATVVGSVVFPRPLGPFLSQRLVAWVGNAMGWAEEVLGGACADGPTRAGRIRLAADAVELRMLTTHLAYDSSLEQGATAWVAGVQRRMVMLLPLLSSIGDRMKALRASGGVTPELEQLLAELRVWSRVGAPPPRSEAERMRAEIARQERASDPRRGWNEVMRGSLLLRLREFVDLRQDMRELRRLIETGATRPQVPFAIDLGPREVLHVDHGLALLSAFATALTILVLCAFWIATGWLAAGTAAELAAAACSLFAAFDDPAPGLRKFLFATVLAVGAVGIGLFGILPLATSFESLALALAAFFVPVGVLMTIPATVQLGTALGFITATLMGLQSTYSADFVSYADGGLAAVIGLGTSAIMMSLVRSVGVEWSARRLVRAGWRRIAAIPAHAARDRVELMGLLLDRLGLLVPRLAAIGAGNDLAAVDALADLRIGINMLEMQRDRAMLPAEARLAMDDVLFGTATHFAAQASAGHVLAPGAALLADIDRALDAAVPVPGQQGRDLLLQLVGIRRGLFPEAPPYQPPPPPSEAVAATPDPEVRKAA